MWTWPWSIWRAPLNACTIPSGRCLRRRRGAFTRGIATLETERDGLRHVVEQKRNDYEMRGHNKPLRERVDLARQLGLARIALDLIENADAAELAQPEVMQALYAPAADLLLLTGQIEKVRTELLTSERQQPGNMAYHWYNAFQAAASGDYQRAGESLDKIADNFAKTSIATTSTFTQFLALQCDPGGPPFLRSWFVLYLPGMGKPATGYGILDFQWREAGCLVLRGLLAMEEGDNEGAERLLTRRFIWRASILLSTANPLPSVTCT